MVDSNETVMYENGRDAGYSDGYDDGVKVAIQALKEVQQYRAIGTIEEFKALKDAYTRLG